MTNKQIPTCPLCHGNFTKDTAPRFGNDASRAGWTLGFLAGLVFLGALAMMSIGPVMFISGGVFFACVFLTSTRAVWRCASCGSIHERADE